MPDLLSIENGIDLIYTELVKADADHVKLHHWLNLFSEACSDFNALFDTIDNNLEGEIETLEKMLVASRNKIRQSGPLFDRSVSLTNRDQSFFKEERTCESGSPESTEHQYAAVAFDCSC